jgi:AbrB family looped-hinge helix DNA binding protein
MWVRPTTNGRIVIPAALRKKLGITESSEIYVYERDGKIVPEPLTHEDIKRVRGLMKGAPLTETMSDMRAEDQRSHKRKGR